MTIDPAEYAVVRVRHALADRSDAPPEVRERFEGRTFTLGELQQRGVRIAGGQAYYTVGGTDWLLELAPTPS
jgi:hypothetical protein